MKLVVAISGASGSPYAKRLLGWFRAHAALAADAARTDGPTHQVDVVLSRTAEQVFRHECGDGPADQGFRVYAGRDYAAPFASGSAHYEAMVVIPASMSVIARIAHGISDDLLTRAADVMLKERRRLIVVPRETPYSAIHLQNMLDITRAGAVVIAASPSFYGRPTTIEQAIDSVLARVLDHLGLDNELTRRWGNGQHDINLSDDA